LLSANVIPFQMALGMKASFLYASFPLPSQSCRMTECS
jgi:hypothetical protein